MRAPGEGGAEVRAYLFALLAVGAALAGVSAVYAQQILITGLFCTGDAELVVIRNVGAAPQNMTGWWLKSDPEASEFFNLGVAGTLDPGEGMTVFSGPNAPPDNPSNNWFRWTTQYRYRDYDPNDWANVLNGQIGIHIRNCPEVEPTPGAPSVGGVAQLPDVSGSSGVNHGALAALAAAAATLAVAAMWYARRRLKQG
jgi:hypothetical protein